MQSPKSSNMSVLLNALMGVSDETKTDINEEQEKPKHEVEAQTEKPVED